MEEIKSNPFILPALISSLIFVWSIIRLSSRPGVNRKLPPSPLNLPIIGNLHQLGSFPHRNLQSLSKKYGPLMLLHFGIVPVLIASSADTACEIMKVNDLAFASRPLFKVYRKLVYDGRGVAVAPYGEYWRQMRSIFVIKLLSNKRVQASRSIREQETALVMKKIGESASGRPVNLSEIFEELANDVICRSAFGRKLSGSGKGTKFLLVMSQFMELLGCMGVGDFIPWLSWVDRVNGLEKRVNKVAKEVDDFLEGVIRERMKTQNHGEDLVDIMLEIYNDKNADFSIDRDSIKALIMDIYAAGTDTISTTLEWTMTELLRNPTVMEKLQNEVREISKHNQHISDDDLDKMHYLKAVIKETLRCHPPVPLLIPRVAGKDVKIKGYQVRVGTIVMINAWAIGRDPLSWDEPEKFRPERFLNSSLDFKGHHFEFIPFGSGRRVCPGITYANVTIEYVLANLVQKFNWELPKGIEAKDVDMSEKPGITIHRGVPLLVVASQC